MPKIKTNKKRNKKQKQEETKTAAKLGVVVTNNPTTWEARPTQEDKVLFSWVVNLKL